MELPTENHNNSTQWNTSVIIALIAVLISLVSAFIGLYETRILAEQQVAMMEQKDASVWPYVNITPLNEYNTAKDFVKTTLIIENKGIGPAILGDVNYYLDGDSLETWNLADSLATRNPKFKIDGVQNAQIDNLVLSPGEKVNVVTIIVNELSKHPQEIQKLINNVDFKLEFCYCSVYGKCWKIYGFKTTDSNDCTPRKDI